MDICPFGNAFATNVNVWKLDVRDHVASCTPVQVAVLFSEKSKLEAVFDCNSISKYIFPVLAIFEKL